MLVHLQGMMSILWFAQLISMRIFTLFFLLLCGLFPQFLGAQDRLPAGLRHLPADLSPELTLAIDRLYSTTEAAHRSGKNTKSFFAELTLDSTITYEPVDAGGGITTNVPVSRSVITREGNLLTTRESSFDGNTWTPVSEVRTIRDGLGRDRLQVILSYDADAGTWVNSLRLESFFRGTSSELLDSVKIDLYDEAAAEWEPAIYLINTYDDDRLLETASAFYLSPLVDPVITVSVYLYNEEGDNDEIYSGVVEGTDTVPAGLTRMTYEDGRVTEVVTSYPDLDEETYVPDERITYTYTAAGQEDSITTYLYDYDTEDWEAISLEDYDYDAEGRLSDEYVITYQLDGEHDMTRESYTYVPDTDYVSESEYYEYDYATESYVLLQSTTYFYSGDLTSTPPLVEEAVLRAWPNPATYSLRIDYAEPAAMRLYDQSGKLVFRGQYLPGRAIDVAGLPSGIYLVSLVTRTAQYRVRVVKR